MSSAKYKDNCLFLKNVVATNVSVTIDEMTSLNLLIGYGSDNSTESSEAEIETKQSTQTEDSVKSKIRNNFFQVFDDSSSGDEDTKTDILLQDEHLKNLKNPFRSSQTVAGKSVFANPYKEAEEAEKGTLEKHVKLTPKLDDIKEINGRKICWNYRKGRCRFGASCIFAHDSELLQKKQNKETDQQCSSDFDQDSVITSGSHPCFHAAKRPNSAKQIISQGSLCKKKK